MKCDAPALSETTTPSFTIDNVYPWGRSLDEYRRMFALSEADLSLDVLAVADGPASFNAELTRLGGRATSCDPLYRFSAAEIRSRVEATRDVMIDLVRREAHRFVWDRIRSPEELGRLRTAAMQTFLDDYEHGLDEGRYLDRSLPDLAFPRDHFDLALCSHFLFLYSDDFPLKFHLASIRALMTVAQEVRIFPLLNMSGGPSPHLDAVMSALRKLGLHAARQPVDYEFQRGGNQMLRVTR